MKSYKLGKKGLLILSLILLLIPLICFGIAARDLEITYPKIPGLPETMVPVTTKALLPKYLIYAFSFFLMIAGIVVFGILIYAGFRYVTSAGDPGKMSDAKNQVFSAILGAVVLFSSFLLLNTINPQLIIPKAVRAPSTQGIIIFKDKFCWGTTYVCDEHEDCTEENVGEEVWGQCSGNPEAACLSDQACIDNNYGDTCIRCFYCGGWGAHPEQRCLEEGNEDPICWLYSSSLYDELAEQNKAMWLKTPVSNLRDFLGTEYEQAISSIYFLESNKDLRVFFHKEESYLDEEPIEIKSPGPGWCVKAKIAWPDPAGVTGLKPRSINLSPRPDGVHLCDAKYEYGTDCTNCPNPDPDICPGWCTQECQGQEKHLSTSYWLLDADIINNVKGLVLKQSTALEEQGISYGAVLHQTEGFGAIPGEEGACELFLKSDFNLCRGCDDWAGSDNEEGLPEDGMGYRTGVMSNTGVGIASATVLQHLDADTEGSVTFYNAEGYSGTGMEFNLKNYGPKGGDKTSYGNKDACKGLENIVCIKNVEDVGIEDNTITSLKVSEKYMAILFDHPDFKGRCQIFTESHPFLRETPLGRCHCGFQLLFEANCHDCLSSFIILPATKLGL